MKMSLQDWHKFGWLKPHETSLQELGNLLAIADRDIADSESDALSADWRFGIAYNAALKLCTMMLYDAGFMPEKNLAHYRTLLSIQYTLGEHRKADAEYLDACRVKDLREEVVGRLRVKYPNLGVSVEDPPEESDH